MGNLPGYHKIGERNNIDVKGICNEQIPEQANSNACGNNNNNPNNISIEDTNLKIDVLRHNQTNKEILHIYSQ